MPGQLASEIELVTNISGGSAEKTTGGQSKGLVAMPVKTKKSNLAAQLASLDNPTPVDLDPENAENYAGSDSDDSAASEVEDDGRSHYAQVDKSRLRDTESERPLKAAYKGQKSSRKDIFEAASDDEDEGIEGSDHDDDGSEDPSESGSDGDMAAFDAAERDDEELDGLTGSMTESESDSGSDQSGFSDEEDGSEQESEVNSEDERQAADFKKLLADDQKAMVQDVVKTATADAQKGKAVKQQLAIYDSLLDSRIKLQKGLQSTNLIFEATPSGRDMSTTADVEASALDLIETLFDLRDALLTQDLTSPPPSRKRKYDDGQRVDTLTLWHDIQATDGHLGSWRDTTLTKWSNKIQAASGLDKSKKFKALSQGILAQIEESKSDREKLLRRTQIKRFKAAAKTTVSNDDFSTSIYDDGDFYQEMLKDLIDSRMLDSVHGNQMKWIATKQPKQKKANVDTRASKGRKLRYHVHEKIQNFMAPAPSGTWHEEQVDELFGSLFGQRLQVDEDVEEDEGAVEVRGVETLEVGDDFKLFG